MRYPPLLAFALLICANNHPSMAAGNLTDDLTLHFDDTREEFGELYFKDEAKIEPEGSVFEIIEKHFMSNALGERWAVITIKNTSPGKRLLKNENVVATYANGSQSYAQNIDEALDGHEVLTKAVLFGVHKFPILMIETR